MSDVSVLAEGLAHPEGPDVLPDGRLIFVETFLGRISVWSEAAGVEAYAEVGGAPNACMLGADGLYVTQNGGVLGAWRAPILVTPSIQRVNPDGEVEIVAATAGGAPLVAPNDLTFGSDGRLYFTDPGHWNLEDRKPGRICVAPEHGRAEVLHDAGPTYPNGITAEPDGSIVWVESYTRDVRRRRPDGSVEHLVTLPEGHIPDGLKVAADGNLYVTTITSHGVDVLSPQGEILALVETGGEPQNCVFAGSDLYVTDFGAEVSQFSEEGLRAAAECGRLLRTDVGVEGMPLFRGALGPTAASR
jgi:gluconolactonase